jgi:NADPH:quinone reductase
MRAAFYESPGAARDVLRVGTVEAPEPGAGEVRIAIAASGVNLGDVKKRKDTFGYGMPYPRIVPHSDGAGTIDAVGAGVSPSRVGERVWCHGAQTYRPFGTAAEQVVVPSDQAIVLPDGVSFEQGACLGIPGITAHRALFIRDLRGDGLSGKTVLVQGGAGAVGAVAVRLARRAGARVLASVRQEDQEEIARAAGAHHVVTADATLVSQVREIAPEGVDHVVEVAFAANVAADAELLVNGGVIAAYASNLPKPELPFWPLLFANAIVALIGSDDIPREAKNAAAASLTEAAGEQWLGLPIAARFPLEDIAVAHEAVERGEPFGRILVVIDK